MEGAGLGIVVAVLVFVFTFPIITIVVVSMIIIVSDRAFVVILAVFVISIARLAGSLRHDGIQDQAGQGMGLFGVFRQKSSATGSGIICSSNSVGGVGKVVVLGIVVVTRLCIGGALVAVAAVFLP